MEREELKDYLRDIFGADPDKSSVDDLVAVMREDDEPEFRFDVSVSDVLGALKELVDEGVLERVGLNEYEPTAEWYPR